MIKSFFKTLLQWKLRFLSRLTLLRYKPMIVGVTGNVGKTSTKDAVYTVLSHEKRVRAPRKNFNNEFGLPLVILGDWESTEGLFFWPKVIFVSLWNLCVKNKRYPEILVLEYGVDHPGDMNYLLGIARPYVGVITAIGEIPVHIEFFQGVAGLAREKEKLIRDLPATGFALLNADDERVRNMRSETRAHIITFGFEDDADMRITNFEEHFDGKTGGVSFKLNYGGSFIPVRMEGGFGKSQAYAGAIAAAVGLIFGMNLVTISEGLGVYSPPAGRLRLVPGIKGTSIIDDAYNASLLAMEEALDVLKRLKAKRKIAVLGDMLEIGKYTLEAHEELGRKVPKVADMLITVGARAKFIAESALKLKMDKKNVFSFESVREAGLFLQQKLQKGDLLLVKGSQGVRMERVVKEVMDDPLSAKEILVRQSDVWLRKKGLYD